MRRLTREGLPPDHLLVEWVQDGLTFEQIAEAVYRWTIWAPHDERERTAAEETLSTALSRACVTTTTGHRYHDCLPWRVAARDQLSPPLRMLRLLGRRRAGLPMRALVTQRIDRWLVDLEIEDRVVAYCPDVGFGYLPGQFRSGPEPDIPIRARALSAEELTALPWVPAPPPAERERNARPPGESRRAELRRYRAERARQLEEMAADPPPEPTPLRPRPVRSWHHDDVWGEWPGLPDPRLRNRRRFDEP